MGCANSRQQTPFEENYLVEQQRRLGFDKLDSQNVDLAVRKFCFNNFINPCQLALLEEELNLTLHDNGTFPEVSKMMRYLEDSRGWESKKLLVLGILCSSSEPTIKAKLLFEAYDEQFAGSLTQLKIRELLSEMCMISCLALGALSPKNQKNSPLIKRYLRKCKDSADRSVLNLMKHFKLCCSNTEFVQILATLHDGLLLTPTGIRSYLHVEYTRNGPGKDFSNISAMRSRGSSVNLIGSRVRSVDFVKQERLQSTELTSADDQAGHASSLVSDLSKLR